MATLLGSKPPKTQRDWAKLYARQHLAAGIVPRIPNSGQGTIRPIPQPHAMPKNYHSRPPKSNAGPSLPPTRTRFRPSAITRCICTSYETVTICRFVHRRTGNAPQTSRSETNSDWMRHSLTQSGGQRTMQFVADRCRRSDTAALPAQRGSVVGTVCDRHNLRALHRGLFDPSVRTHHAQRPTVVAVQPKRELSGSLFADPTTESTDPRSQPTILKEVPCASRSFSSH